MFSASEPEMTEDDLRIAVQRIIHTGTYVECRHSSQDRKYRNISDEDIQACLTGHWKLGSTEYSEEYKNWKYRITGQDIEGEELTLLITVSKEMEKIKILTKF